MSIIDNLVAYWSLDEASGDAIDAHGNNDLTDNATVGSASGKVAGGRDFELDTAEYFSLADNADLSLGSDTAFTFAGWLKQESQDFVGTVVHKGGNGGTDDEYKLFVGNGPFTVQFVVGNGSSSAAVEATGFGELSVGVWYFVIGWHDPAADRIRVQINNGTVEEAVWSGGTQNTASEFNLGGRVGSALKFDGILDEVGFWKGTLTSDQRAWLYNSGNGRSYADIVAEGSVVAGAPYAVSVPKFPRAMARMRK